MSILLDNLSNQEIKELIINNKVNLNELSADALTELLDYETDMLCFGEGNVDFICEISAALDRKNDKYLLAKERISEIIEETKNEKIEIIGKKRSNLIPERKITFKKAALITAAIILIFASSTSAAAAFGFDLGKLLKRTVGLSNGECLTVNGITFIHYGEIKYYSDIEELVENEKPDILYPSKLPEDIRIETILITDSSNGDKLIQILTSDKNISFQIETVYIENTIDYGNYDVYKYKNYCFYLFKDDDSYFAYAYIDSVQYCIQANTREDLIMIIDNLKE